MQMEAEYRKDLLERIKVRVSQGEITKEAFVREVATRLQQADVINDWQECFYQDRGKRRKLLLIDAYDYSDLDNSIDILVSHFVGGDEMQKVSQTEAKALVESASNFVEEAVSGKLHIELEDSTAAAGFANWLFQNRTRINSIRVFVVTDGALASRSKETHHGRIGEIRVEMHTWDLPRFYKTDGLGEQEEIDIEVAEYNERGISALEASIGDTGYSSYLCILPGSLLAKFYDRFGSRLLESNVRSFLSVRGAVNKGIRNTILKSPERFFAFNNGITATASSIETKKTSGTLFITRIKDLQVVNGGQTTVSLFSALKADKADLESVFVQLKLSVVTSEQATELVPLISRYANSQNKVSDADFSSNHPIHQELELISRKLWAPPKRGSQNSTHWFYERARGQYANEQVRLKEGARKIFQLENPKPQLITKTDLAKYENSWAQFPHLVSQGAQKNFFYFTERIQGHWETDRTQFNERWYQHSIAKAILFSTTERIVSDQDWYEGGYRANVVTYTIAKLSRTVTALGKALDLDAIWKKQAVTGALERELASLSKAMFEVIVHPPGGFTNITEWCKKEKCWTEAVSVNYKLSHDLINELLDIDDAISVERQARSAKAQDIALAAVTEVVKRGPEFWAELLRRNAKEKLCTPSELAVLTMAQKKGNKFVPNDVQAKILLNVAERFE